MPSIPVEAQLDLQCRASEASIIENNPTNLSAAFEILLDEVDAEIDFVNSVGAKAFGGSDYDLVREALERSDTLIAFRGKLAALRKEWKQMVAATEPNEDEETGAQRRDLGKLENGLRTPEVAYYRPILKVLEEMGGSGTVGDVLERVGQIMKPILKDVDYEPLASAPDNPRWRNAAQWARARMVNNGLLKEDSPRGIWEITDSGRAALRQGLADIVDHKSGTGPLRHSDRLTPA